MVYIYSTNHLCTFLHFAVRKESVRGRKVYVGSISIPSQRFVDDYEDSNSTEFQNLAMLVNDKVREEDIRQY